MSGITVYEFDFLAPMENGIIDLEGLHGIPPHVFNWLESQCLINAEKGNIAWLQLTQRHRRRCVQLKSFVGVIRTPDGYQIEVLPKIGKANGGDVKDARQNLIKMLCCLGSFRHIKTESALLIAARMPILEVFIGEFLRSVEHVVKCGLRSNYITDQDNLHTMRGKLMIAQHLQQNLCRADRFFTEHDDFTSNRPENRLLHSALRCVLLLTSSQLNQQLARELCFAFADVPTSSNHALDFQRAQLVRGMDYYSEALDWARLILEAESPLTGSGANRAISLLFPMEVVFEAFVAKHLAKQLAQPFNLKTQAQSISLIQHKDQNWFRLKPDLLIQESGRNKLVLDTKWKIIKKSNR